MVSHRELEAVVAQVNAEFERLRNRIAELENAKERPTPSKSRSKRVQQTKEDTESSN